MLTQRGIATLALGMALCVGAWVLSLPELVAAGAALLSLLVIALIWVWIPGGRNPRLATTVAPSPTLANTTIAVGVSLQLRGFRPAVVRATISDGRRVRIWSRPGKAGTRSGSFPLAVGDRGEITVGPFSVHRFDPLALARRRLGKGGRTRVTIWPEMRAAPPVPAGSSAQDDRFSEVKAAPKRTNVATELEPASLRPYVPGDELRLMHWRASARGRGLMVRTFEPATAAIPLVLFDDRALSHTPESFEMAVSVVASVIGATHGVGSGNTSARLLFWSHLDAVGSNANDVVLWGPDSFDQLARCVPAVSNRVALNHPIDAELVVTGPATKSNSIGSARTLFVEPLDPELDSRPTSNQVSGAISSLHQLANWEAHLR